jgi:hypothetical protein
VIALGTPLLREIDKGLARSRVGIVLVEKSGLLWTNNYLYDDDDLLQEVDSLGNILGRYTQSPEIDRLPAASRSNITAHYEADALGSITSLLDQLRQFKEQRKGSAAQLIFPNSKGNPDTENDVSRCPMWRTRCSSNT